jgi:hypothetical protein
VPSPFDSAFNPLSLDRIQVTEQMMPLVLDRMERAGTRFVAGLRRATMPPLPSAGAGR